MQRFLLPAVTGLVIGVIGYWLISGYVGGRPAIPKPPPASEHASGAGKFGQWQGPKWKFLHIYLAAEKGECPPVPEVFPDDNAAEIWRSAEPKKVVWKVQGGDSKDEWTIETDTGPDHLPGPKMIKIESGNDAYWSKKPVPAGQDPEADWHWKYKVTLKRGTCEEGSDTAELDPPVHIRK